MKSVYKNIFVFFLGLIALYSCMERVEVNLTSSEFITFEATMGGEESAGTRSISSHFTIEEEVWMVDMDQLEGETKATLWNKFSDYDSVGVLGYTYSGTVSPIIWNDLNNKKYVFDGDQLVSDSSPRWSTLPTDKGDKFRIYAYAPRIKNLNTNIIEVDNISSFQEIDYIAAVSPEISVNMESSLRERVPLAFEHIFTAVQFKADFACTITSISLKGINKTGSYTIGSGWTSSNSQNYTMNLPPGGIQVVKGAVIGGIPVLMIPQKLGTGASLEIKVNDGGAEKTYSVSLSGREWLPGRCITYTLKAPSAGESDYIYFDLAAGNITIDGSSYSGKIFKTTTTQNDAGESVTTTVEEVTGKHTAGNKYYVYQSTEANRAFTGSVNGTLNLPTYDPVTYKNQPWADYISNNPVVEDVIHAWDYYKVNDGDTPKGEENGIALDKLNQTKYDDGVRGVGRSATEYNISVTGAGTFELTIDNIYSIYQENGNASRTTGTIGYVPTAPDPTKPSTLTINIVGDNRLGCIHYNNTSDNGNKLIFKGTGTLTVADADYNNYLNGTHGIPNGKSTDNAYFSNYWCAAIGNNDGADKVYGIVIESGVIYAGTTKAENCTAIGGGGNGYGQVTINGGTVTAVATTTGTAIGGGIGFNSAGGQGYVTINGGNVYAYNHANKWNIPSSAIGGAGSSASSGSLGTVVITGGNVYAESSLGTAIGGGSSRNKQGGNGDVTISGGHVIAKTLARNSAGIGGGTTCSRSENDASSTINGNGGSATIKISGNPIIRTGSIGGGYPGTKENGDPGTGKIGSAKITISGGDIQAQFVMADSPDNSFNMSGGLIRNSDTSDDEYTCIQKNGGAVYMQKGTFTMEGGEIVDCSAEKGGAIYIEGDSETTFTMTGGTISRCHSLYDGGGVYLQGGKVTLQGGEIFENIAQNGTGGGVSVIGGDFYMKKHDTEDKGCVIKLNGAFSRGESRGDGVKTGYGGGVYIAPEQNTSAINVELLYGDILQNSSDKYGGGICVDMSKNTTIDLDVKVGEETQTPTNTTPLIQSNNTLLEGGGIYVYGAKARVSINDGKVSDNTTSGYQKNKNISVQGDGLVVLNAQNVTDQETVTFSNNGAYYAVEYDGSPAEELIYTQEIVRSNRNILIKNKHTRSAYEFVEWNTRRDGTGKSYTDGDVINVDESLTLYAQWKVISN